MDIREMFGICTIQLPIVIMSFYVQFYFLLFVVIYFKLINETVQVCE